jgi:chemotaxis protein methyltransferase CheR
MTGDGHARRAGGDVCFTDADFAVISKRAHRDFGLHLPESKKDLVYSRLLRRLRQLGLADFQSYCAVIEGPDGDAERLTMLSALTTNVTHFMREEHHFRMLRETVLPPLIAAARAGRRVRLWSAGCSAGQEPYSLAFTLLGAFPDAAKFDIRILATDIDREVLDRAREGRYRNEERVAIPEPARSTLTEHARGSSEFTIGPAARTLIGFGELNLIGAWPMRGPFDIIFCRNVAIYFDKATQERLWHRFAGLLAPGGHLFIGHSERVSGRAETVFRNVGVTVYRREMQNTGREPETEGTVEWG